MYTRLAIAICVVLVVVIVAFKFLAKDAVETADEGALPRSGEQAEAPLNEHALFEEGLKRARVKGETVTDNYKLRVASSVGDLPMVKKLVADGVDVNGSGEKGYTALMAAAGGGRLEVARFLVKKGADVNGTALNGSTALMAARDLDVARFLIKKGADVNAADSSGETLLMKAANGGEVPIVKLLVSKGARVNAVTGDGKSALTLAAEYEHVDVVRFLIEKGADMERDGPATLQKASERGHAELVALLTPSPSPAEKAVSPAPKEEAAGSDDEKTPEPLPSKKTDINEKSGPSGRTALITAAAAGERATVQELLAAGATVDITDKAGNTALMAAARGGHKDVVKNLLVAHKGKGLDTRDGKGNTATLLAMGRGHRETVRLLIEGGADGGARNNKKESVLTIFLRGKKDDWSFVALLIDHGADVRETDKDGFNRLWWLAVQRGPISVVETLLKKGVLQDRLYQDDTPLHLAAKWGRSSAIRALIKGGADVNTVDKKGTTPLHVGVKLKKRHVVKALIEGGADPNRGGPSGAPPLETAIVAGDVETVRLLIDHGAKIDLLDEAVLTAHLADRPTGNDSKLLALLLEKGMKTDVRDGSGDTLLLRMMPDIPLPILELLLKSGADPNSLNKSGRGISALMGRGQGVDPKRLTLLVGHGFTPDLDPAGPNYAFSGPESLAVIKNSVSRGLFDGNEPFLEHFRARGGFISLALGTTIMAPKEAHREGSVSCLYDGKRVVTTPVGPAVAFKGRDGKSIPRPSLSEAGESGGGGKAPEAMIVRDGPCSGGDTAATVRVGSIDLLPEAAGEVLTGEAHRMLKHRIAMPENNLPESKSREEYRAEVKKNLPPFERDFLDDKVGPDVAVAVRDYTFDAYHITHVAFDYSVPSGDGAPGRQVGLIDFIITYEEGGAEYRTLVKRDHYTTWMRLGEFKSFGRLAPDKLLGVVKMSGVDGALLLQYDRGYESYGYTISRLNGGRVTTVTSFSDGG